MIGRRALAGAMGMASAGVALIPLLGIPSRAEQALPSFVISPFERPGGKVVFVSSGRDLAAFALPRVPGSPLGRVASLFSVVAWPREARSLLWSAKDVWARTGMGRLTLHARKGPTPPEEVSMEVTREKELGALAEGALVSTPNQVSNFLLNLEGYASFVRAQRNRRSVFFAAGSDGLLHAFDAGSDERTDPGSGSEIFAFAPRGVTSPVGMDGRISFDDVYLDAPWAAGGAPCSRGADPTSSRCQWRTIVAGGLGHGGRTIFALDVTRPDSAPERGPRGGTYPTVLWEFGDESDEDHNGLPDLAFTTSAPSFGRVRLRNVRTKRVEDHDVLFFGGGSDPMELSGTRGSSRRSGNWLYVVDLESGRLLYKTSFGLARIERAKKIDTVRRSFGSIPSALGVFDLDQDGYTDAVYFGDSEGQLWKLLVPESEATAAEYDSTPSLDRKRGRVANAPGSWCPDLIFDGNGGSQLSGSIPNAILHPPALVRAGSSDRGEPIYGVVSSTSASGSLRDHSAASRVLVIWDQGLGGSRASGEGPIVRSLASEAHEPLFQIEGPGAAGAGACGRRGSVRAQGWSLTLGTGESITSDLVVYDGYIYLIASAVAPSDSGDRPYRFYRLDLETGDACHGTDCCVGSSAFWNSAILADGNQDRGIALPGDLRYSPASLRTFVEDGGIRRLGLLGQSPSGVGLPSFSLVTRPLSSRLIRRSRREL